ncbi:hypothetical protein PF003_g9817 [Phytophthora fragariae]|nr:hypothetical protein PF003_g9817 [Phytophthora fragariae]
MLDEDMVSMLMACLEGAMVVISMQKRQLREQQRAAERREAAVQDGPTKENVPADQYCGADASEDGGGNYSSEAK